MLSKISRWLRFFKKKLSDYYGLEVISNWIFTHCTWQWIRVSGHILPDCNGEGLKKYCNPECNIKKYPTIPTLVITGTKKFCSHSYYHTVSNRMCTGFSSETKRNKTKPTQITQEKLRITVILGIWISVVWISLVWFCFVWFRSVFTFQAKRSETEQLNFQPLQHFKFAIWSNSLNRKSGLWAFLLPFPSAVGENPFTHSHLLSYRVLEKHSERFRGNRFSEL